MSTQDVQRLVRTVDPAGIPPDAVPLAARPAAEALSQIVAAVQAAPPAPPAPQPPDLEVPATPVKSCELRLPNGDLIVMAPPRTPAMVKVARAYRDEQDNPILLTYGKVLCYVESINGQPPPPLSNKTDFEALMMRFRDDGLDMLSAVFMECWPPVTKASLGLLKKNL